MKKIIIRIILIIVLIIAVIAGIITYQGYTIYKKALDEISVADKVSEIQADENYTKIEDMPQFYLDAVVAVEDHRFYEHKGIDFIGIARALYTNIRDGEFDEGGSTITQQVAKNVIFDQEQTFIRKLGEVFAAHDLEKNYSKEEIFAIYVNTSYFGDGYYGIYDASYGYYNKAPMDLNLDEASMLAGIPNAPSDYAPTVNLELAKKRQQIVLNSMVKYGYISQAEADAVPK